MDIDDVVGNMVEPENLDLDNLRILANALGVDADYPPIDDMYPDWENELRVEVHKELFDAIEFSIVKELAKIKEIRTSMLNLVGEKPTYIGNGILLDWADRLEALFSR